MAFDTELLKGHAALLILSVLAEAPAHGYRIAAAINERSNGLLTMREGSLYPALRKLEQEGCIQGEWEGPQEGRRRRVYRITRAGRAELARVDRQRQELNAAIQLVIGATA